jgi:hypothetical protein
MDGGDSKTAISVGGKTSTRPHIWSDDATHNLDEGHPALKKIKEHHKSTPVTPVPLHSSGASVHSGTDKMDK